MSEETIIEGEATEVPEEEPTGDETTPEEPKAAATALKDALESAIFRLGE